MEGQASDNEWGRSYERVRELQSGFSIENESQRWTGEAGYRCIQTQSEVISERHSILQKS